MYRRPYRSFRTRKGASPRRRGRGLKTVKEPYRWEVGHFYFSNFINITDLGTPNSTIVLSFAQIRDHFGVTGTEQGRALDNAVRWLEVGGIVFRYEILGNAQIPGAITDSTFELTDRVDWRLLLVSDRLDVNGSPVSIPNWFNVTNPIIAAASTSGEDRDTEYPTRIHWQNFHGTTWANREGNGTGALTAGTVHVDNRRGGANLRLRLRIDDEHGLFWHFAQVSQNLSGNENVFIGDCRLTGTMYYRWRFG